MEHPIMVSRCSANYNKVIYRLTRIMRKYFPDNDVLTKLMFETFKIASKAFMKKIEEELPDEMLENEISRTYLPDLAFEQLNFFLHFQNGKRIHDGIHVEPRFFCDKLLMLYYRNGELIDFKWVFFFDTHFLMELYTDN